MKFEFKVIKQANFYFLLHNLSRCEWPWPYRPPYNAFWKKEIGGFSKEESKALKEFHSIYKKYFLKKYIGKPFFLERDPWKKMKTYLSSKDGNSLKKIFDIWGKKFDTIWRKDSINLRNWKKALEKESNLPKRKIAFEKIEKILSCLYNAPSPKLIKVFLMINKKPQTKRVDNGIGGERGRGLEGSKIILVEISRCPLSPQKINYAFGVIFHEIIHCYFGKVHLLSLIKRELKDKSKIWKIEEIINRSFFPLGILGKRFFNMQIPNTLSRGAIKNITPAQTRKILNLSEEYILRKNKIDKEYIRTMKEILKL